MKLAPELTSILITLLVGLSSLAQADQRSAAGATRTSVDYGELPLLLDLRDDFVTIRYTPGSLDRAARLQVAFRDLVKNLSLWTKQPRASIVYLLSREEWLRLGVASPYGFPGIMAGNRVVLPAWGDAETAKSWGGYLGGVLPSVNKRNSLRGTPDADASLVASQLISEVAVARVHLSQSGIVGTEPWVDPFVAHLAVVSSWSKNKDPRKTAVAKIYSRISQSAGGAGAYSFYDYAPGLPPEAWLWYQAQFFEGAVRLERRRGWPVIKSVIKRGSKRGGTLRAEELLARFPELVIWQQEVFSDWR